jgi:LEA14-like dessication related protein
LQITNPTSVPLSVASIFADVISNEKKIGKIALDKSFNISPKKENLITIPVQIQFGQALASIITMILNKDKVNLSIKGIINSEGTDININEEIPLTA